MGSNLIIVVFAVVVIGGMGSIMGSILTGLGLGVIEGLTRVFYPEAVGHRGVHHHGDRADDPAGRLVRQREIRGVRQMNKKARLLTLIALAAAAARCRSSASTRCS